MNVNLKERFATHAYDRCSNGPDKNNAYYKYELRWWTSWILDPHKNVHLVKDHTWIIDTCT